MNMTRRRLIESFAVLGGLAPASATPWAGGLRQALRLAAL